MKLLAIYINIFFAKISILFNGFCVALYLNETCNIVRSGEKGICRFVDDCPIVKIEALEQSLFPTLCGFYRDKEIICCPNEKNRTKTDSKPVVSVRDTPVGSIAAQSIKLSIVFSTIFIYIFFFLLKNVLNMDECAQPNCQFLAQI